ncbi:MAG: CoA transferase [Spirochaetota bacterium]|nr:CoA transferase [Spirochaetota bacterium]
METENYSRNALLSEIKALDLADEKGSFILKILADLGARVIKIEKPGGDPSRNIGPFWKNSPHPEESLSFKYNNMNKLGITLNILHDKGKEIFLSLIKRNDIVVETFPSGYLEKIGLGYNTLKQTNHKLILVSVSGFGQDGPKKDYKSCDLTASAFGGQMYISGSPSAPPLKSFDSQSYYTASLFAATGILLAIRKRSKTGEGEHIDISLQEAVASTLEHVMPNFFYDNRVAKREGNLQANNSFCIMPCKDGFIHLTLFQQWETLIEWIDNEDMAEDLKDEKYKDEEYRLKNRNHIIEIISRWTQNHTVKELFELGQLMQFPWAPVHSPKDLLDNPQLKERNFFIDIFHPEIKRSLRYPGMPYKFSFNYIQPKKSAPAVGQDNKKIYQDELRISAKELNDLALLNII